LTDRLPLTSEIQRKLIHISAALIPLIYYLGAEQRYIFWICAFLAAGFISADLLRLNFTLARRYFLLIFSKLLRETEKARKLTGASYLFAGMTLTVLLFDKAAAVPAMLIVTIADPAAALIGKRFGRKKILNKTAEGSLGFFVTTALIMITFNEFGRTGMIVAIIATVIEFLPLWVDDNILIPLGAGLVLTAIR
jgi:dolichol kinase